MGLFFEGFCRTGFGTFFVKSVELCSGFLEFGSGSGPRFEDPFGGVPGTPFFSFARPGRVRGVPPGGPFLGGLGYTFGVIWEAPFGTPRWALRFMSCEKGSHKRSIFEGLGWWTALKLNQLGTPFL